MQKSLRRLFGQRVKQLRISSELSQEAFADRCEIARSYMSRIERGESNASLDVIETLSRALNIEPWELFIFEKSIKAEGVMVPYAKDGTCFHPGLASSRDGSFVVGDPTCFKRIKDFDDALAYLRTMHTAKWKRPNKKGNWGVVTAVRWGELTMEIVRK